MTRFEIGNIRRNTGLDSEAALLNLSIELRRFGFLTWRKALMALRCTQAWEC